jgi:adenylate kinase
MRLIITGSPGTGKSVIAKMLSQKLSYELVDIALIAKKNRLVSKTHEVDISKLSKALGFLKGKKHFVAEGHLACEMKLPADFIFVLRCEPKVLEKRLKRRNYPKKKLEENKMAEILDYCVQRVRTVYKARPIELDTSSRTPHECVKLICAAVKNKKKTLDNVDYSGYLLPRS